MSTLVLISILIVVVSIYCLLRRPVRVHKNLPPSPGWPLPLLGHLPFLGLEPHEKAIGWIPKYGPIVSIKFGSFPCVIISDYKLIKEAFALPAFLGRPNLDFALDRSGDGATHPEGVIFSNGKAWTEQRGFTHKRLKELGGFGTRSMESVITEQISQFIDRLRVEVGTGTGTLISTHVRFNIPVVNALWAIIAGKPFAQNDPEIVRATKMMVKCLSEVSVFVMLPMFLPWLRQKWLPDWITRKSDFENIYKPIQAFAQPAIDEHYATRVPGARPRDLIDAYIDEIECASAKDPNSSFNSNGLSTTVQDLFVAGTETVSVTLEWICLLLASYPDVQENVAQEVKAVVGHASEQSPSLQQRKSMPYTEAVIHETMRFRTIMPLGVYRSTLEDVALGGYTIPKDTMIYTNTQGVHLSKEIWGADVEEFRPERWLSTGSSEGTPGFVRHEGFLPFGSGKRVCLGEQMARDELFLFTTSLFQAFRIELDRSTPRPTLAPKLGGSTQGPFPHQLVFKIRD